ncbi:MAG TPA: amidase [Burkholderiales bacterium]|nr:amidase [Burkholderiales bacterium]
MSLPDTINATSRLLKARELSPVELVDALLKRIVLIDPVLNSFLTVTAELARDQARKAESEIAQGRYRGPLHGIPFGLKDIYETAGIRTTGHSRVYENYVPRDNASIVDKLYDAGAILMGKLATHELAHGGPSFDLPWPPARNPWNPEHFSGGSSSGSAAAIAGGLVLAALGSDTGGSIRTPASLCGLAGIKPTFGLVSRHGVMPNCFSLDHCGPLARTAGDCAIVLEAIAGYDPKDRSSARAPKQDFRAALRTDLRNVRVGVVRRFGEEDSADNDELRGAADEAVRVLQKLGARLRDVRLRPLRDYSDVWILLEEPETFAVRRKELIERPQDFGSTLLERTLIACLMQGADYVHAQQERARMVVEIRDAFADCDVLVTPGAGPAPKLDPIVAKWPNPHRYIPFSVTGNPAVVVCTGFSRAGLPLSMQLVGRPFDDAGVLGIAHAYEQATEWSQRRAIVLPESKPAPVAHRASATSVKGMDPQIVDLCARAAENAGLRLPEGPFALLCYQAPNALAIMERIRRPDRPPAEPAAVFTFPQAG